MVHMRNVMSRRLIKYANRQFGVPEVEGLLAGEGRCRRFAGIFSPGDSKETDGTPKVMPSNDASPPPSEWPIIQMFDSGYM